MLVFLRISSFFTASENMLAIAICPHMHFVSDHSSYFSYVFQNSNKNYIKNKVHEIQLHNIKHINSINWFSSVHQWESSFTLTFSSPSPWASRQHLDLQIVTVALKSASKSSKFTLTLKSVTLTITTTTTHEHYSIGRLSYDKLIVI
jgi:hypothetical protein